MAAKKELWKNERGGITVFLVVIFISFLMLTGVIIDISRMLAADKKVQQALNTAARSALAGYDKDLISQYGIFALDTDSNPDNIKREVLRYFKLNLEAKDQGIRLIRYHILQGKTEVEGFGNIAEASVLKKQIKEYMKYKAPVTITENVIEKIKAAGFDVQIKTAEDAKSARTQAKLTAGEEDQAETVISDKDEKKFYQLLSEIKRLLENPQIQQRQLISGEDFETIDRDTEEDANYLPLEAGQEAVLNDEEAEARNDILIKQIENLLQSITDTALQGRDKIYLIEYVMDKFTFLTSQTERGHYFDKGEVEYILCGKDQSCPFNMTLNSERGVILEIINQIWTLRYAIDALDRFVTSKLPEPRVRLAVALAQGFFDSAGDMYGLLKGEAVPISPSIPGVTLKYSDYLRLLLLTKSESEILRKTMQMMQVNIKEKGLDENGGSRQDFSLINCHVRLKVHGEVAVNLIFLPVLQLDKLYTSQFVNGKYIIRKDIYMGY